MAIENRRFKLLLIALSVLLFLIPVTRYGGKGYTDFFFFNIGYYSLAFVFLYYILSGCIKKFGFNNKSNGLKLILFIIFEMVCIYQFSSDKAKLNESIDKIQSIIDSPSSNVSVPALSEYNGVSGFSRRINTIEKLSYVLAKVRNSQAGSFAEIQKQEQNLTSELQNNLLPTSLLLNGGIFRAESTIQQYNELIIKKRHAIGALYKQMDDEVVKFNLSEYDLNEFKIGESEGKKSYNDIYDIQEKELIACKELVDFIKTNISEVKIDNNQFIFYSNELLQQYNNIMGKVANLSSQETALIEKNTNGLNDFKILLKDSKI